MKTAWADGRIELDAVVPEALADAGVSEYGASVIRGRSWFEDIKGAEEWKAAAAVHGADEATWPTLSVGTIHASKGLEADNVIVSDELPGLVLRSMRYSRAVRDEERRVSYVAVTRARKKATVLTLGGMGRRAEWMK
jgi:DNA helicase-2/ATP-dependent DNA helicase PcrA